MRRLLILVALLASGCPRKPAPFSAMEEDRSIVFPQFFEQFAQTVGVPGVIHELDGVTLQALRVAVDDFLPADTREGFCWERREAHRYRVIRRADILFVRIDVDFAACDPTVLPLDSGVEYAISMDGRILRRIFDGEPRAPSTEAVPDAGARVDAGEPGPTPPVGATWGEPSPSIPLGWLDGGATRPALKLDGGTPPRAP
jgi:hypothetical protein